jgi:hypothetical protein
MFDNNAKGNNAGASSSLSPWTQMTQLTATDGKPSDNFGSSVAISKDASTIVVGARDGDSSDTPDSGAAYLFRTTSSTTTTTTVEWIQIGKFVAEFRAPGDELGSSIAIEDNIVVVGAEGDDFNKGSAYVIDTFPKASPSPSYVPSKLPSLKHSARPSMKPSRTPSFVPSRLPSLKPSARPSMKPSRSPSYVPSGSPSTTPSESPSVMPSGLPSFLPSPAPIVNTGSPPVKDTMISWNTIWSLIVSGFVVLGMIRCLLL